MNENVDNSLAAFRDLLLKANRMLNLVSRRSVDNVVEELIRDSLLVLEWESCLLASPVLDVGSGGGFPGIPLKLCRPTLTVHLLDANSRKCAWLESIRRTLKLEGVEVFNRRIEDFSSEQAHSAVYGTIVSRATAPLRDLLKWSDSLLRIGGELIVWKGTSIEREIAACDWTGWSSPRMWRQPSGLALVKTVKLD